MVGYIRCGIDRQAICLRLLISHQLKKFILKKYLFMGKESIKALRIERCYTQEGVNPFDLFDYEFRSSVIRNPKGDAVFEMHNVEVPKFWSQVATDILAQKYFRKAGVP